MNAMHESGLFERWAVNVAGGLTWEYTGLGGALEYWLDGPEKASQCIGDPFSNVAIVFDADRTFHRVRDVGSLLGLQTTGNVPLNSLLAPSTTDNGWVVSNEGENHCPL